MICPKFTPTNLVADLCEKCSMRWTSHTQGARSAFFFDATPDLAKAVTEAVTKSTKKCPNYVPSEAWAAGGPFPTCATCGKPLSPYHNPGDAMRGIREFKAANSREQVMQSRVSCGQFYASLQRPGHCLICTNTWQQHSDKARTLEVERFTVLHKDWCKCLTMNGDVPCDCLTDTEKQVQLENMGDGKVSCKQFKSRTVGNANCGTCGFGFYRHAESACQGFKYFQDWHASNMTDRELLEWFVSLGKTRDERLQVLRRILADPNVKVTNANGKISPSMRMMRGMLEAITGEHKVSAAGKPLPAPADNAGKGTAVLETTPDQLCFGCGQNTVPTDAKNDLCADCEEFYARQGTPAGPAGIRVVVAAEGD